VTPRFRVPPPALASLAALVAAAVVALGAPHRITLEREHEGGEPYPSDWFYAQRVRPDGTFPQEQYEAALQQLIAERGSSLSTSAGLPLWQPVGPYNIGGRVTALAVQPDQVAMYLGSANGGVWKSWDGGVSWACVTEHTQFTSIGALAIDPNDWAKVYAGTGEANSSVDSYDGNGLWRTSDAGGSWKSLGLTTTGRIAAVVVDPGNSQHLLVAAMGRQFSTGPDRGVYRSLNGGQSWTKVLFVSDSTGACDLVVNPIHPDTMFCATWERVRRVTYRRAYGPECGIWRSIDRGATWTRMSTGLPVPSDDVGRIGLAISPTHPGTIYAQIGSGASLGYVGLGFYRSTDGGTTWERRDLGSTFRSAFGGFCWYSGETGVDPGNPDRVFACGVDLLRSEDGGQTWTDLSSFNQIHPDVHALWVDPADANHIFVGHDGGFSWTTDGATFDASADLPISQFYDGAVDPTNANNLFGGTQDNNTLKSSTGPYGWFPILGGDGFYALVDPVTPNVVFSEYQYCCSGSGFRRSTTGGPSAGPTSGWVSSDRFGWNTPIAMNPRNHNLLLAGSQFAYRSTNNGVSWSKISGDLTTNPVASLLYGTITTLDVSKADTSVYYAGTDDGRVWRTIDRGVNWTDISAGLPKRWVTRVVADPLDPQVVYVTLSGFTQDAQAALVFRSANRGTSWSDVSGNLPSMPANDLAVDPNDTQTIYLATDIGVYMTHDLGGTWLELGAGLPQLSVYDIVLHTATRQLFAFTHGRSAWKFDLGALPVSVPGATAPPALALSAPRPNPAPGAVRMTLELSRRGQAEVALYDVIGRRVSTMFAGPLDAGRHELTWDRRDASGNRAAAGVYFARAVSGGATRTQRVVLTD